MVYIDTHVHDRGGEEESYKETPQHVMVVAYDSGLDAIAVMPNTKPALFTRELVEARYKEAMSSGVRGVRYFIWMGLTKDPEQIKRAIDAQRSLDYVLGFKMYAGQSTNELGIVEVDEQFVVFDTLAKLGYDGPLAIHAEKEARMKHELWTPNVTISHCFARPEISETESIRDQIGLAFLTGFKGLVHFVHVSTSLGVEYINLAKSQGGNFSCAVCPHHLAYNWEKMLVPDGVKWKMNPPLRKPGESEILLEDLRVGRIDILETDHAPHSWDDKTNCCASGIPGLPWHQLYDEFLRQNGFSERRIEEVHFSRALELFGIDVDRSNREIRDIHRGCYSYNPHEALEKLLGWPAA